MIGYVLDLSDGHFSLCFYGEYDFSPLTVTFTDPQFPADVPLNVRFQASDVIAHHPVGVVSCTGQHATVTFYGKPKIHDQFVFPSLAKASVFDASLIQ